MYIISYIVRILSYHSYIMYQSLMKCGKHIPNPIESGQQCFNNHVKYSAMRCTFTPLLAINNGVPAGIGCGCYHEPVYVDRRGGEPSCRRRGCTLWGGRGFCDTDLNAATDLRTDLEHTWERKYDVPSTVVFLGRGAAFRKLSVPYMAWRTR